MMLLVIGYWLLVISYQGGRGKSVLILRHKIILPGICTDFPLPP